MRTTTFILAALPALISAHGDGESAELPKIVGGANFFKDLKSRNMFAEAAAFKLEASIEARRLSPVEAHVEAHHLEARATERCGPGIGSCDAGYCCSDSGYCGQGIDYCQAPDCQFQYGPACDANTVPPGASTKTVARPLLGSIPYGGANVAGIQDCIKMGTIALTYDDGPYIYTKDLLDLLDRYNAKATFFITGNNIGKGRIDDCSTGYPQLIQRMYQSGHQIASHTWSHQNLSALTQTQFNNQMVYNEMAFRNILGFFPTYMRPPFSECGTQCSNWLKTLGYHATYFDLDTSDYLNTLPTQIQKSKDLFINNINTYGAAGPSQSNFLAIAHDIHYQTVYNLTEYMLKTITAKGYGNSVTVGECLGDPIANWYRAAGNPSVTCSYTPGQSSTSKPASSTTSKPASSTTSKPAATTTSSTTKTTTATSTTSTKPASTGLTISQDGACGGTVTCAGSTFGNCCSQYGWCGTTTDHCAVANGCQSKFGTCSGSSPTTTSAAPANPTGLTKSTEGNCGGKITCLNSGFGNCCSQYGWCGTTTNYCGTGCQKAFGTCT